MSAILFRDAALFDGFADRLAPGTNVLVLNDRIHAVSAAPMDPPRGARIVDLEGRTLMPGLIDAHFHVMVTTVDGLQPPPTATLPADTIRAGLERSLSYGFTTIRDAGGADRGLQLALQAGLLEGPRVLVAGRMLSPTGGPGDSGGESERCACCVNMASHIDVVDGVKPVTAAVRARIDGGADHIKITSDDDAFSDDRGYIIQYSESEIAAAVREARDRGRYVMAHAQHAETIVRAASAGVRSIEHAVMIDSSTADLCANLGTYVVPTLVGAEVLVREARHQRIPSNQIARLESFANEARVSLEVLLKAGVRLGFGTDLNARSQEEQGSEFISRTRYQSTTDVLRSATSINAELVGQSGRIGCVVPGAQADLIVVDGDPFASIDLLTSRGTKISAVMKDGRFYRNSLV
jgi:imidazolonepropionase-like amidohydrolase